MTEMENQKSNWLAIASFVLALVWVICCLSVIGIVLWIICWILALIFGIIALCKKQTKWAALTGTIVSGIFVVLSAVLCVILWNFVVKHSDVLVEPVKDFSAWVDANPDLAALMNNDEFSDKFEDLLDKKLKEKYGENYDTVEDFDWVLGIWEWLFDEMKDTLSNLATEFDPDIVINEWEKDNEALNVVEE